MNNKKEDGYHDIETVLANVDISDTLRFEGSSKISLDSNVEIPENDNLVIKAAQLMRVAFGTDKGVAISLEKSVPIEAGLGGGSADAAATIMALNRLWDLSLEDNDLLEIGAKLGSDINFFLLGGTALAEGRGEKVSQINTNLGLEMVIAKPDFGIKASEAYSYWDERSISQGASALQLVESAKNGRVKVNELFNDLEEPVLAKYPQLKNFFEIGYEAGAEKVMLSGSGSAFFAIVDKETQNNVYGAWKEEGLTLYRAKTMNRSFDIDES